MVPSKDTDTLEPTHQRHQMVWGEEAGLAEAGLAGCRGCAATLRTEGGPSHGGQAFHTSEPLPSCAFVYCVALYLSPQALNFIWRSRPALTWDFVLQIKRSNACETHSGPHSMLPLLSQERARTRLSQVLRAAPAFRLGLPEPLRPLHPLPIRPATSCLVTYLP